MQKILDTLFSICIYLSLFLIGFTMTLATADERLSTIRIIGALIIMAITCHFFAARVKK